MRLIEVDQWGNWELKGVPWKSIEAKEGESTDIEHRLYMALCKLKDYEATGLEPDEIMDYLDGLRLEGKE